MFYIDFPCSLLLAHKDKKSKRYREKDLKRLLKFCSKGTFGSLLSLIQTITVL